MADGIDYNELNRLYFEYLKENLTPVLQSAIDSTCANGGALWDYISQLVVAGVDAYVYGVYVPKMYRRRSRNGGLGDPNNVVIETTNLVLDESGCEVDFSFRNIAGPGLRGTGGGSIEKDVLGGTNYKFANRDIYGQFSKPRNFYRVYEHKYSETVAGDKIVSGIREKVMQIMHNAMVYALKTVLNIK